MSHMLETAFCRSKFLMGVILVSAIFRDFTCCDPRTFSEVQKETDDSIPTVEKTKRVLFFPKCPLFSYISSQQKLCMYFPRLLHSGYYFALKFLTY
jgi:hypothetical protein